MEVTMPTLPEDELVRGQVYLCQTGPCVSCGSCCGLYNMPDLSRDRLRAILAERTGSFAGTPRSIDAILAFEQERLQVEGSDFPIPDFHHCVFVGLIQDGGERIGCLLHPLALGNGGVDWRGLSFYGGAACKYFFCPTYDELEPRHKRITREVLNDWYEYGLIIPEHRFLATLLGAVEDRLGAALDPERLCHEGRAALAELLRLKLSWPFRDRQAPLAWNFFSTKETHRPTLLGPQHAQDPGLRQLLHELETLPEHAEAAQRLLRDLLGRAADAVARK
jgi:hypothetical protein